MLRRTIQPGSERVSIAAAEARVTAQEAKLVELARAGQETTVAEQTLATLRRLLDIERAERRMWSALVSAAKNKAQPAPRQATALR